jgi:hypothetical protein
MSLQRFAGAQPYIEGLFKPSKDVRFYLKCNGKPLAVVGMGVVK